MTALYQVVVWLIAKLIGFQNSAAYLLIGRPGVEKLVKAKKLTPNGLTKFRIVMATLIITQFLVGYALTGSLVFLQELRWYIFAPFLLGALSDALDGPLARRYYGYFTDLDRRQGINFDRHADKMLTTPLLVVYLLTCNTLNRYLAGVIIGGDMLATILAIIAKRLHQPIASNNIGKGKMAVQCFAIGWMVLFLPQTPLVIMFSVGLTLGFTSLLINTHAFIKKFITRTATVVIATSQEAQK